MRKKQDRVMCIWEKESACVRERERYIKYLRWNDTTGQEGNQGPVT